MRKFILLILALLVPLALAANVQRSFEYYQVQKEVEELEETQNRIVERNKQVIIELTRLRSPLRSLSSENRDDFVVADAEQRIRFAVETKVEN